MQMCTLVNQLGLSAEPAAVGLLAIDETEQLNAGIVLLHGPQKHQSAA